ncbi:MAG: hypothetical protein Q8Q81_08185 [Oxalobacteraceae bacterium]|nr:hypothetical protein [Oxalobacteraceae bacterium]
MLKSKKFFHKIYSIKTKFLIAFFFISQVAFSDTLANFPDLRKLVDVDANYPSRIFSDSEYATFDFHSTGNYKWFVTDWLGKLVTSGSMNAPGKLNVPRLSPGYYRLRAEGFSGYIVFAHLRKAVVSGDSRFSVDSAHSWVAPHDKIDLVARNAELAGIHMVRDRFRWADIQPVPGKFNWSKYDNSVSRMAQHGIQTLGVFHDAPEWVRVGSKRMPTDLLALYRFCEAAAIHFKADIPAWEFWNEENNTVLNPDPAWDFAAAQKACYLGMKAGLPSVKVLIGAKSETKFPENFMNVALDNGIKDYFDIYNFHTYLPVKIPQKKLLDTLLLNNDILKKYKIVRPFWVTEVGLAFEGDGKAGAIVSSNVEHDDAQETAQAIVAVKSQILLNSLGSERTFSFILPPYNEKNKVWGFFRWDFSPKPAYVALSNLIIQLGKKKFVGHIRLTDHDFGYLYGTGSNQTLVLWSDKPGTPFPSALHDNNHISAYDLMGAPIKIPSTLDTTPIYVTDFSEIAPTTPYEVPVYSEKISPPKIVLRVQLEYGFGVSNRTYLTGDSGDAFIDVYNFHNKLVSGSVYTLGSNYVVSGLNKKFSIEPMSYQRLPIKIKINKTSDPLVFIGSFNGEKSTPLVLPIDGETNSEFKIY